MKADFAPLSPREAIEAQKRLAREVVRFDDLGAVRTICGVDVHYTEGGIAYAAAVVLGFPGLEPVEAARVRHRPAFPYVPGLFAFREAPAMLEALAALPARPDLLVCDGHGIAHPRRCGLASHLGVLAGIPSIGVAKTLLVGAHGALGEERGARAPVVDSGETVGAALRTRAGVTPVYVSIGHRVSLETAVRHVLACTPRYRLPEPIRAAHRLARGGKSKRNR